MEVLIILSYSGDQHSIYEEENQRMENELRNKVSALKSVWLFWLVIIRYLLNELLKIGCNKFQG